MNALHQLYYSRAEKFAKTSQELHEKYQKFALVRLIVFVAATAITILAGTTFGLVAGFVVGILALGGFAKFVFWHLTIQREQRHQAALSEINKNEIACLEGKYQHLQSGEEYVDVAHPYTVDLDVFGDYSFFQFTNRASTVLGRNRYADYLKNIAEESEILQRQEAIAEIKGDLAWRQNLQAHGLATKDDLSHLQLLEEWLIEPPFVLPNKFYQISALIMPLWVALMIYLMIVHLPWQAAIWMLLYPGWILKKTLQDVNETQAKTEEADKILGHYARLIAHLEEGKFNSKKLQELQRVFLISDEKRASEYIQKLSKIIRELNVRNNAFAIFLNIGMLWDLRQVRKLEKWKVDLKDELPKWLKSLAEFEAILSLSTLYYNNPSWIFPTIHQNEVFTAEALGHPLIEAQKRVSNDIAIPTKGHIKLITGSNMAGKSTFLRTVGLNIVLACCGAPVCAKKLGLPLLKVYTSMRTQDALHESTSSFYAELKRLKFIIEAVENGDNIFFLLDEILKGTNSKDRHTGSKALIQQLIDSKGSGIIATHDLELGELEAKSGGSVENLRIEVEIKDGKLHFDYKVKKGVSESFNATLLMKQMGIRIK